MLYLKGYFGAQSSHYAVGDEFLGKILSLTTKTLTHACYVTLGSDNNLNNSITVTTLFPSSSPRERIHRPCNKTIYLEPLPSVHTIQLCKCVCVFPYNTGLNQTNRTTRTKAGGGGGQGTCGVGFLLREKANCPVFSDKERRKTAFQFYV